MNSGKIHKHSPVTDALKILKTARDRYPHTAPHDNRLFLKSRNIMIVKRPTPCPSSTYTDFSLNYYPIFIAVSHRFATGLAANKKQLEKSVYIVYNVGRNKREGAVTPPQ